MAKRRRSPSYYRAQKRIQAERKAAPAFIDALRECLGLEPLYATDKRSRYGEPAELPSETVRPESD